MPVLRHGHTARRGREVERGWKETATYRTWRKIIERCTNPTEKDRPYYAGRGIKVCDRWLSSFEAFLEDMGERPGPGYSIDRIKNDLGYEPGNCRWATNAQQSRNRSDNNVIEFRGERRCLADWAEAVGLDRMAITLRLRRGWSIEAALTTPLRRQSWQVEGGPCNRRLIEYGGEVKCLADWAASLGMSADTLGHRLKKGWSVEKALTTPKGKPRRRPRAIPAGSTTSSAPSC